MLLASGADAHAADDVAGEGFALTVPAGFRAHVEVSPPAEALLKALEAVVPEALVNRSVFRREDPRATIVIAQAPRQDFVADPVASLKKRLAKATAAWEGPTRVVRRQVGGFEGVEVTRSEQGQAVRALVVPGGSFVVAVLLHDGATDATQHTKDWTALTQGLSLSVPEGAHKTLVLWAGLVAAFVLVWLLVFRAPAGRPVDFTRCGEELLQGPSAFESVAGASRAHDGLPVFHGGGPPAGAAAQHHPPGLRSTVGRP